MIDDDTKMGYLIGKFLGEGAVNALSMATYVVWPAEATVLLYIFMKKYHKNKNGIAGFSRDELEQDIIWSDMQVKKLKKEKRKVEERIKALSNRSDMDSQSSLRTAKYELTSINKRLENYIGRREFDSLLLIILEHKKDLEKKGAWKEMQPPKNIVKQIEKEQKRIENAEINFEEFSGYLRLKLDEILGT